MESRILARYLRLPACALQAAALCVGSLGFGAVFAQDPSSVEPPKFRLRTDPYATADAQALRDQLRYLVDSQGPINPLSDYGKHRESFRADTARKPNSRLSPTQDPEAALAPKLDKEAAKRLQASGLTLPSSTLGVITLLPPPEVRPQAGIGSMAATANYDDGFRPYPSTANPVLQASAVLPASAALPASISDGVVRTANFYQDDPIANIPPTLNSPPVISGGVLPGGGSLPGSIPVIPQSSPQLPPASVPLGVPPAASSAIPNYPQPTITQPTVPQPTFTQPTIPPPTMPSNSVPTTVMPAPPTYYIPVPSSPQGAVAGTYPQTGTPYAGSPMPTYSRAGTFVNSAPFVSAPPAAVDARWMVSPAVWQQASNTSSPACNPSLASTAASGTPKPTMPQATGVAPPAVPIGVNGVTPTTGLVPPAGSSPFAYAPPAAMPPPTVYAPANGGYVPIVGFGQAPNAQLGRGLYGQPTAYVDGQPVRNFLRYIFP